MARATPLSLQVQTGLVFRISKAPEYYAIDGKLCHL